MGRRERGKELHHPELARIPSLRTLRRDGVYPLTNAHGTQASSLSSLSFSPTILFTPASLSLFDSPRLLHYPARSFARTNLARPFSLLPFLFLLRLLSELTHPFLTLCTVYRVSA